MQNQTYHYAIIGAGLAGLQLAVAFSQDVFFKDKKIIIIEPSQKNTNDKTWCFWEKGKGKWESLIKHRWAKGAFISKQTNLQFNLHPYQYKKIESLDFYAYAQNIIRQNPNINFVLDEVKQTKQAKNQIEIRTTEQNFIAQHCFDSRIDKAFYNKPGKHIQIWQPFKGWLIQFDEAVFDIEKFTMMDYRLQHQNNTSFTYVLPFSTNEALVEFTLFVPELIEDDLYDIYLKKYIETYISKLPYKIKAVEQGVIPMTTYPFHQVNNHLLTKIGTAGSWVRPSTGYAFKYTEKYVQKIIENLKNAQLPGHKLIHRKSRLYDALLLDILEQQNALGSSLFERFYKNNPVERSFRFLDGETSLLDDVQLMATLPAAPFLKALARLCLFKFR